MVPSKRASTHPWAPTAHSSAPEHWAGFVKDGGVHADCFLQGKSGNRMEGPVLPAPHTLKVLFQCNTPAACRRLCAGGFRGHWQKHSRAGAYLCAKENKPKLLNNSSTSVTTEEQLHTRPRIPHGVACPNTRRQLPFPLSGLQRAHHGCQETGLETSAGTPAPRPLASDALTAHAAGTSGDLPNKTSRPSGHTWDLNGGAIAVAGKPGPRIGTLRAPRIRPGGEPWRCGGPTPAPASPTRDGSKLAVPPGPWP